MVDTETGNDTLLEWQIACIEELGFTNEEAVELAHAKISQAVKAAHDKAAYRYEVKVDHHLIRKMLDKGATRKQVLEILT